MWSANRLHTIGDFSLRKIALFFVAVLTPAVLWIVAAAPTAFAVDATWTGDDLVYQEQTYNKLPQAPAGTSIPANAEAYEYRQPGTPTIANIIYFPPGTSVDGATSAQHISFTVVGDIYSSPGPLTTIGILGRPPVDRSFGTTGTTEDTAEQVTPCAIKGIGWIVCPLTRWLADGMDVIFNMLKGFLEVRPLTTDTTNPMFRAWEIMRNLANMAFVLAFLIIIYGQVTAHGMSNYEVKKMLPRLIIAAVLVNISYYICSIGIDISNTLGATLQQLFLDIRGQLVGANTAANNPITWQSMATLILSGGTAVTAAGIAVNMAVGSGMGILALSYQLIPFLVGALLAVLVALLILAARQALITVLVIVAPLAFVAYLLPNTEKWFERWRETFVTMLMVFPMFSVVFGASQLAGTAIIQNAKDINTILVGLFVQVAPIIITPLLVKLSGSLLGRIAGFVNNPNKGILDRTRNWANDKAEESKKSRIAEGMKNRENQSWLKTPMRNWATRGELRRRDKTHRLKEYDETSETEADLHYEKRLFSDDVANNNIFTPSGRYSRQSRALRDMRAFQYSSKQGSNALKAYDEAEQHLAQTGNSSFYRDYEDGEHGIKEMSRQLSASATRKASAEQFHKKEFADELVARTPEGEALRNYAGIADIDPRGPVRVEAKAQSAIVSAGIESVKDIQMASEIMPGNLVGMRSGFNAAITKNNTEEIRAFANMMAESANPGVEALRKAITEKERDMSPEALATFKHFVNSHPGLNEGAEDIVKWSRENRLLAEITHDRKTWENVSAASFMKFKQSTQTEALNTGGISLATQRQILENPGIVNVKPAVIRKIRANLGLDPE